EGCCEEAGGQEGSGEGRGQGRESPRQEGAGEKSRCAQGREGGRGRKACRQESAGEEGCSQEVSAARVKVRTAGWSDSPGRFLGRSEMPPGPRQATDRSPDPGKPRAYRLRVQYCSSCGSSSKPPTVFHSNRAVTPLSGA